MTHITDYTTKDLAADIHRICVNDPGDESIARAERAINAAIAAAVAAEREACAKVAYEFSIEHNKVSVTQSGLVASGIAAAIRARGDGAGRK